MKTSTVFAVLTYMWYALAVFKLVISQEWLGALACGFAMAALHQAAKIKERLDGKD